MGYVDAGALGLSTALGRRSDDGPGHLRGRLLPHALVKLVAAQDGDKRLVESVGEVQLQGYCKVVALTADSTPFVFPQPPAGDPQTLLFTTGLVAALPSSGKPLAMVEKGTTFYVEKIVNSYALGLTFGPTLVHGLIPLAALRSYIHPGLTHSLFDNPPRVETMFATSLFPEPPSATSKKLPFHLAGGVEREIGPTRPGFWQLSDPRTG